MTIVTCSTTAEDSGLLGCDATLLCKYGTTFWRTVFTSWVKQSKHHIPEHLNLDITLSAAAQTHYELRLSQQRIHTLQSGRSVLIIW